MGYRNPTTSQAMGGISGWWGESPELLLFHTRRSTPHLLLSLMGMPWPCRLQYLGSPVQLRLISPGRSPWTPTLPHDARPQPLSIDSLRPSKPVPWDFYTLPSSAASLRYSLSRHSLCVPILRFCCPADMETSSPQWCWCPINQLTFQSQLISTHIVRYATQTTPIPISRESSVWNRSQGSTVCQSLSILIF